MRVLKAIFVLPFYFIIKGSLVLLTQVVSCVYNPVLARFCYSSYPERLENYKDFSFRHKLHLCVVEKQDLPLAVHFHSMLKVMSLFVRV